MKQQPSMFPQFDASLNMPVPEKAFDGATYEAPKDFHRLNAQCLRVYEVMRHGQWWTLRELSDETGDPEASVSARLRDLRKPKFGGFEVRRIRNSEGSGTWKYKLVLP